MNYKRKSNLIVYLIFGIIITSLVTTVTLSRYMTNVSGNGTINVASLDAKVTTLTFTPTNLDQPGAVETMRFNVVNYNQEQISEVDQSYSITITTANNLPFTYELWCVDTGENGIGINTINSPISTDVQLDGGLINHSVRTTHEYQLTIKWPANQKDVSLAEELELIKVIINSEQVLNQ